MYYHLATKPVDLNGFLKAVINFLGFCKIEGCRVKLQMTILRLIRCDKMIAHIQQMSFSFPPFLLGTDKQRGSRSPPLDRPSLEWVSRVLTGASSAWVPRNISILRTGLGNPSILRNGSENPLILCDKSRKLATGNPSIEIADKVLVFGTHKFCKYSFSTYQIGENRCGGPKRELMILKSLAQINLEPLN
jgi:hypothetical protein